MKKVLSIVLSLVMVLCMMPVMAFAGTTNAAYSDISGEKCEGAVNVLDALGVIDGYEDGTYRPDQVVTRAEMAKLIITALGMDSYATATTSSYSDMQNAQWAIPVVEYATNLGIVEGVGNGKFSPGNPVTYEQAVTMIVRAIGYTTDCNEMNGTWPAIYVQKATALGIFDNVEGNQYGTGANRGDVAIMLYNAIDLPQVYADKDGATHYKNGSEEFTVSGTTVYGVSMLSTLNKGGEYSYKVVTGDDADNALTNMRSYVGVAGKVVTNEDGDVLAVSDIACSLITGKFNSDLTKFTVNGTEYIVKPSTVLKAYDGSKTVNADNTYQATEFVNGVDSYIDSLTGHGYENKTVTLGAKISGKTITQIWSVAEWNADYQDLFTDADAVTIANKSELGGKEFLEDVNGDIDYTKFVLEGVESLDEITKDNVVYVYAEANTNIIRKVSVGTKVVEGEWTKFADGNTTSAAKLTVDGTVYEAYKQGVLNNTINPDGAEVGDTVKLYLDYNGDIFKIKQIEGMSEYALVLDYVDGQDTTGISGKNPKIRVLTSQGEYVTLEGDRAEVGSDFGSNVVKNDTKVTTTLQIGDIITYSTDVAGLITKIKVWDSNTTNDTLIKKDVSDAGYYDGKMITDSTVVFVAPSGKINQTGNGTTVIDDADAKLSNRDALLGIENVQSVYYAKDGVIKAMVIDNATSSEKDVYGVILKSEKINDKTYPYELTMLVNGEEKVYQTTETVVEDLAPTYKESFYKLSFNASGKVTGLAPITTDVVTITLSGQKVSLTDNGYIMLNGVIQNGFDADAIFYVFNKEDGVYEVGTKADILSSEATVAYLFDTDKDKDGIGDVVCIK